MRKHLNVCIRIEETAGKIYRKMAISARLSVPARQTVLELADDEEDHANQLRLALRLPENVFVTAAPTTGQGAQELLKQAEQILSKVSHIEVDDQQAISIGIELEKKFRQVHLANSYDFKKRDLKEMFAAMALADAEHCQRLINLQKQLLTPCQ